MKYRSHLWVVFILQTQRRAEAGWLGGWAKKLLGRQHSNGQMNSNSNSSTDSNSNSSAHQRQSSLSEAHPSDSSGSEQYNSLAASSHERRTSSSTVATSAASSGWGSGFRAMFSSGITRRRSSASQGTSVRTLLGWVSMQL